jgi:hypothetical protein
MERVWTWLPLRWAGVPQDRGWEKGDCRGAKYTVHAMPQSQCRGFWERSRVLRAMRWVKVALETRVIRLPLRSNFCSPPSPENMFLYKSAK